MTASSLAPQPRLANLAALLARCELAGLTELAHGKNDPLDPSRRQ